jgi:hypothetical protein
MTVTYAPDAHDHNPKIGPVHTTYPMMGRDSVRSIACNGAIVVKDDHEGVHFAAIVLGVRLPNGGEVAIHYCLDAARARKIGAALVQLANDLDNLAGNEAERLN